MKRIEAGFMLILLVAATFSAKIISAAPKVDPVLQHRLSTAQTDALFGVILTFHGDSVSAQHITQLQSHGISGGYRMNNLPILAVNATAAQITQMVGWSALRSIYLNAPVELYLHQS